MKGIHHFNYIQQTTKYFSPNRYLKKEKRWTSNIVVRRLSFVYFSVLWFLNCLAVSVRGRRVIVVTAAATAASITTTRAGASIVDRIEATSYFLFRDIPFCSLSIGKTILEVFIVLAS